MESVRRTLSKREREGDHEPSPSRQPPVMPEAPPSLPAGFSWRTQTQTQSFPPQYPQPMDMLLVSSSSTIRPTLSPMSSSPVPRAPLITQQDSMANISFFRYQAPSSAITSYLEAYAAGQAPPDLQYHVEMEILRMKQDPAWYGVFPSCRAEGFYTVHPPLSMPTSIAPPAQIIAKPPPPPTQFIAEPPPPPTQFIANRHHLQLRTAPHRPVTQAAQVRMCPILSWWMTYLDRPRQQPPRRRKPRRCWNPSSMRSKPSWSRQSAVVKMSSIPDPQVVGSLLYSKPLSRDCEPRASRLTSLHRQAEQL